MYSRISPTSINTYNHKGKANKLNNNKIKIIQWGDTHKILQKQIG